MILMLNEVDAPFGNTLQCMFIHTVNQQPRKRVIVSQHANRRVMVPEVNIGPFQQRCHATVREQVCRTRDVIVGY